jgi:hypothetical protein
MSAQDLPAEAAPEPGVPDLQALLFLIDRARREQEATRGPGAHPDRIVAARWALMEALEGYAAALNLRNWPVPRRVQSEIQLLRGLCRVTPGRPDVRR